MNQPSARLFSAGSKGIQLNEARKRQQTETAIYQFIDQSTVHELHEGTILYWQLPVKLRDNITRVDDTHQE
jgi:hypothetical protein